MFSPASSPRPNPSINTLSGPAFLEIARGVLDRGARFKFHASGHSMHPCIRDGDNVVLAPLPSRVGPRRGDVVLVSHPHNGHPLIHRIVKQKGPEFLLRGDNSPTSDGLVGREHILGKAVSVERNGRTCSLGLGPERRLLAFLVGTGLYVRLRQCVSPVVQRVLRSSPAA